MPPRRIAITTPVSARETRARGVRRRRAWLGQLARIRRGLAAAWRRLNVKTRRCILLAAALVGLSSPLWIIILTVAFVGHSLVFPLSPFFLREKVSALVTYAAHRPLCLLSGHPDLPPLVAAAEVRYHLPRSLLAAVVQVETNGHPHRISAAGAMGVAQLMPGTARLYGVAHPFDTEENLDGAARLLRDHLHRFGHLRLAIAAYHAGPGAVMHGVPNNGMTPQYVERVLSAYRALRPAHDRVSAAKAK